MTDFRPTSAQIIAAVLKPIPTPMAFLRGSQLVNDADDEADIRREDRAKRARLNWRCRNQPCDGSASCPDCREHAQEMEEMEAGNAL